MEAYLYVKGDLIYNCGIEELTQTLQSLTDDDLKSLIVKFDDAGVKTASESYKYILSHGFGPGTLPKDVDVISTTDKGFKLEVELNRKLTDKELYDYDIKVSEELLEPKYDSRKSFYGKADVEGNKLYSYDTLVAEIVNGEPKVYNLQSATTLRHVKEFLKQKGFKAETKAQIMKDYFVNEDIEVAERYVEDAPGEYTIWSASDLVSSKDQIPLVKIKTDEEGNLYAEAVGDNVFDQESYNIAVKTLEKAKEAGKSVKDTLIRLDKTLNHNDPFFSVEFDRSIVNSGYELIAAQALRTLRDDLKAAANLKSATYDSVIAKFEELTGVNYGTGEITDKDQYDTILGLQLKDPKDKYEYIAPKDNVYIQRLGDLVEDIIDKKNL